jgi:aspartate carbamoyltransferase catalytic subunit
MGVRGFVVRHEVDGAVAVLAESAEAGTALINAGDGRSAHPTQGLLDMLTIRQAKGGDFSALKILMVGDVRHSRVARSDLHAFGKLGAKVRLCGPPTMIPQGVEALGATVHHDLRQAVEGADAVITLRIQHERIGDPLIPGTREYSKYWGLNVKKAEEWLTPSCVILHPGPINRGVELSPEVADGPRSVILDQVQNGVAVRMAILYLLAGGGAESEARA